MDSAIRYSDSPKDMWDSLHERYASTSSFNKDQMLTAISRKRYNGQPTDKYLAEWDFGNAQLKLMGYDLDDDHIG